MEKNTLSLRLPAAPAQPLSAVRCRLESLHAVRRLSHLYGLLLEEPVTPRQTLHLVNVQAALASLLVLAQAPLALYLLLAAWLCLAYRGCRNSFRKPGRN